MIENKDERFARLCQERRAEREAREASERAGGKGVSAPLSLPSRAPGELDRGPAAETLLKDADAATAEGGLFYETPIGRAYRVLLARYRKKRARPAQMSLFSKNNDERVIADLQSGVRALEHTFAHAFGKVQATADRPSPIPADPAGA